MVAACDYELLGKCFKEKNYQIDITPEFYKDLKVSKETFMAHLHSATIINIVGKRVTEYAIEAGVLEESGIITINGVPHAQIYRMV
jgi:hypothetical protein